MNHREICPRCKGEGRYFDSYPPEFGWKRCLPCFGSGWILTENKFVFEQEKILEDGTKLWWFKRMNDPTSYIIKVEESGDVA